MADKIENIIARNEGKKIMRNSNNADIARFIASSLEAMTADNNGESVKVKSFDRASIMREAWAIYHDADNGDPIKPLFSICLKIAWANARNEEDRVLAVWNSLTPERQLGWLKAAVKRASKDEIAYSVEDKYNAYFETVAWFMRAHDLDEFVSEAWIKLNKWLNADYLKQRNEKRLSVGKCKVSLASLVYQASLQGINKVWRDDIKHGKVEQKTKTDKDGNTYSYIDTLATSRRDNTEIKALGHAMFEEFINGRDEYDRIIIEGIMEGYKQKEIASMIGITAVAVHKRIMKLREALNAAEMPITWLAA